MVIKFVVEGEIEFSGLSVPVAEDWTKRLIETNLNAFVFNDNSGKIKHITITKNEAKGENI